MLVLGVATIAAYGSTFYAFGVLVEPVHADTGWSLGTLGAAYSLSLVLGGLGAFAAGTVVDRLGGRLVLLGGATVGAGLLASAAAAPSAAWFVALWGAGAGVVGALAFYHVTIVVMVRARGGSDPRAYAALTFLGGLSSPIYLPLTALSIDRLGWRPTQVILGGTLAAILALSSVIVPSRPADISTADGVAGKVGAFAALGHALAQPRIRLFVATVALASIVGTAMHAYQIPAMHAAGLSLAAASSLAAIRGLCSLPGRALLAVVVRRTGAPTALAGAYLTMAIGTAALLGGGMGFSTSYAVITGIAYGSLLPLQALVAAEVFPESRLGTLMGAQQGLNGLVAAAAPVSAGLLLDRTGSFTTLIAIATVGFGVAAIGIVRLRATATPVSGDVGPGSAVRGRGPGSAARRGPHDQPDRSGVPTIRPDRDAMRTGRRPG